MPLDKQIGFWPVVAALVGNSLIAVIKFIAAAISGSSVLFAEAIHSVADTLNQTLLLIGIRRSLKKADPEFGYGYGIERFFWALIAACGIFFVGAGITAYRGITALAKPSHIEVSPVIFAVLLLSLIIESYTLWIAIRSLRKHYPRLTWRKRLSRADPSTLAVFLEDSVAVLGVLVAALSISVTYYTENPVWDAAGSIVISILLAAVAVILIVKNRAYLIGRSMPRSLQKRVMDLIAADPVFEKIIDFKSIAVGFDTYRIKCEVEFNGVALLREQYQQQALREDYEKVAGDYEAFKKFSAEYADRIPRLMGKKIDEIEKKIRTAVPQVRHIDIEIN
ncbi:MAG TPA: cation diffusion facilitator family transporter [Candidatus Paceibacterota bacterium]|uniref:Cation efflux protein transmembrane domain-containing protein n=1 Tax=Candidatus Ryanbacteria bacterium RIFCSPHIGHO2_01_FULL_45_22 TaxID=1802114 RepID=A0A1G2G2S0_9BACT|nr:MAG: hypothetical protein A2719_04400 [Candidatus Ryanbacteria bacterium RIFCSPHIGHO2_01_FULL_45_22]